MNNTVKFGRKLYIIGLSTIKGIQKKEFNSKLNKYSTRFRPLGGTLKQIETYLTPILNDDTSGILVQHIGCNNIANKQLTENEITEWVADVFILSLIVRAQKRLNDKVISVNNILKRVYKLNGLG